jgi:hypothetical protein
MRPRRSIARGAVALVGVLGAAALSVGCSSSTLGAKVVPISVDKVTDQQVVLKVAKA